MTERLDMSAFEQQFDDGNRYSQLMPNDDFDRLAFLKERIEDITGVIGLRANWVEDAAVKQMALNQQINALKKLIANLVAEREPYDKIIDDSRRIDRADKRTQEQYERELARLLEELAARERLIAQRNALDRATSEYAWRPFALKHQLEGAHRLVGAKRALLGDKPGLGKTLQSIMVIDMLRAQGKGQKVLIFTPKSVLKDFERAFHRWSPGKFVHVLNQSTKGSKADILTAFAHFPDVIVLTNYEVWRKDLSIKEKLKAVGFDTIILDEAHILKGAKSFTTQGIRDIVYAENRCPKCGHGSFVNRGYYDRLCAACEYIQEKTGDFCSVKNVYPMTGTPILNKPQELWPLLNMIDREGFPTENDFLNDYCYKAYDYANDRPYWTFGAGGSERLLSKLGMKYTARTRDSAGVTMPPQEIKHHYLELDPEKYPRQYKFIQLLREQARLAFSDEHQMNMHQTLDWYTRMRQAASWPDSIQVKGCPHEPHCTDDDGIPDKKFCYAQAIIFPPPGAPPVGESAIMDESEAIINEAVESGDRIVVFSQWLPVLGELERRCESAGIRYAKLVGGLPDRVRQEYIDDFNANETKVGEHKYDVLLVQFQTGRVGLNLHGAQQLLCVEREWNPGMEEQTIDRLRRIDSQFNSTVHLLHCAGTATDLIDALQEMKKGMLDGFENDVAQVNLADQMRKFLEG